jgi:hypothetical protein
MYPYLFPCAQDAIERIQFTVKDEYTVLHDNLKTKLGKIRLTDPEPKMPSGWETFDDVSQGDYVLVSAHSVVDIQKAKKKYVFDSEAGDILTKEWLVCEENMSLADLTGGDDFLLFYQRIDTGGRVCAVPSTGRSAVTVVDGSDEEETAGAPPKKAAKKNAPATKRKRRRK